MSTSPSVFVIHRHQDTDRADFIKAHYEREKIDFQLFDAIDGHGDILAFKPYADLLGAQFWMQSTIKLGALACYISHYKAWQMIADSHLEFAVIAEDDSAPTSNFHTKWEKIAPELARFDLIFLNNRTAALANQPIEPAQNAIETMLKNGLSDFKAPGADGYVITRAGAKAMIAFTNAHKICYGVDWALIAASWDSTQIKMRDVKEMRELKQIFKIIGNQAAKINAGISQTPLFMMEQEFTSSINHKVKIEIEELKNQLV